MGSPGCPDFAFSTTSIARARMVSMQRCSRVSVTGRGPPLVAGTWRGALPQPSMMARWGRGVQPSLCGAEQGGDRAGGGGTDGLGVAAVGLLPGPALCGQGERQCGAPPWAAGGAVGDVLLEVALCVGMRRGDAVADQGDAAHGR